MDLKKRKDKEMFNSLIKAAGEKMNTFEYPHTFYVLMYDESVSADYNGIENRLGSNTQMMIDVNVSDYVDGALAASECTAQFLYDLIENDPDSTTMGFVASRLNYVIKGIQVVEDGRTLNLNAIHPLDEIDGFYLVGIFWTDEPLDNLDIQAHRLSKVRDVMLQGGTLHPKEFRVK